MNRPYIEFKKQRDFGALLSDTFNFIRNEFKPFMKTVLTISAPALILFIIAMSFYTYVAGDIFDFGLYGNSTFNDSNLFLIFSSALLYMVSLVLVLIFISTSTLHYIKSYIENSSQVNFQDVKRNVSQTFWGYTGLGFLKYLSLFFALLFCILPVLYVMVPMFIVFCVYVFEEKRSATDSYSYSFYLVNEDFWITIALILVLGILMYILSIIFSIPAIIYMYAKMGVFSGEIDPSNLGSFNDPFGIFLNVLSTLFQLLLNIVSIVASAFVYFNLNEKRNFTGTFERISNIGNTEE